jgi:hypothetical protein
MVLGLPLDEVLRRIGHTGSEIWWPDLPEPLRRRAFHLQEMVDLAFDLGKAVIPVEACPTVCPRPGGQVKVVPASVKRIQRYMEGNVGVLVGAGAVGRHAVAWDGAKAIDPCEAINEFHPDTFYLVKELR